MKKDFEEHLNVLQQKIYDQTLETYGEEVFKRWKEPRFVGRMEDPHAFFSLTGSCGDTLEIFLKFENNRVSEARFISDGCGPSFVCGSTACELALGRTIEQAALVSGDDILQTLNGLPEDKEHCAFLAAETLRGAIKKAR